MGPKSQFRIETKKKWTRNILCHQNKEVCSPHILYQSPVATLFTMEIRFACAEIFASHHYSTLESPSWHGTNSLGRGLLVQGLWFLFDWVILDTHESSRAFNSAVFLDSYFGCEDVVTILRVTTAFSTTKTQKRVRLRPTR